MHMTTGTTWEIKPHTKAKHELLERYLDAWFPILASWNERVLFIDGFAGPSVYASGEPGSPRVAIASAMKQQHFLKGKRVIFLFNEANIERFRLLNNWQEQ